MSETIDFEQRSFSKDFFFACSVGLNVGFILGIIFIL